MPKMWKKNEINKWTYKAYKYMYKSDYPTSLFDTHIAQT